MVTDAAKVVNTTVSTYMVTVAYGKRKFIYPVTFFGIDAMMDEKELKRHALEIGSIYKKRSHMSGPKPTVEVWKKVYGPEKVN